MTARGNVSKIVGGILKVCISVVASIKFFWDGARWCACRCEVLQLMVHEFVNADDGMEMSCNEVVTA